MKILIFDTETSGLPEERNGSILSTEKWPYVLQLSYILYDTSNNELIEYSDKLVKILCFGLKILIKYKDFSKFK